MSRSRHDMVKVVNSLLARSVALGFTKDEVNTSHDHAKKKITEYKITNEELGINYSFNIPVVKIESLHTETKEYFCAVCKKHFKSKEQLTAHAKRHKKRVFAKIEAIFSCPVCKKDFKSKLALAGHMASHSKTLTELPTKSRKEKQLAPVFRCEVCKKTYNSPQALAAHRKSHENEFKCQLKFKSYYQVYTYYLTYKNKMKPGHLIAFKEYLKNPESSKNIEHKIVPKKIKGE